jgi:uncharacterized protein (DUF2336 family)
MQHLSLIDELESAVRAGSPERRVSTLRRITDLFLHDADRLSDEQIQVFDDVLCLLVEKIEKAALAELGTRLAPVDMAPMRLIRRLARDQEIAVAAPVLKDSKRLGTADLLEIAQTSGQDHLLAISERAILDSKVTDVLVVRGDHRVVSSLARNAGAHFSEIGFNRLVKRAEGNDELCELVVLRNDLPRSLLQELLKRATDAVLARILALALPERRDEIEVVIHEVGKKISNIAEKDYSDAERAVAALAALGELDESALVRFVQERRSEETTVALARLSSTPIKLVAQLINGHRNDALLLPCKVAGLRWATVEFILRNRLYGQGAIESIIEIAQRDYANLTPTTAQRALRFMSVRDTARLASTDRRS